MRWFYAKADDVRCRGLASDSEIKALIRKGELCPDDLVWPADENLGWTRIREYASLIPPKISDKPGALQVSRETPARQTGEETVSEAQPLSPVPRMGISMVLRAVSAAAAIAVIFIVLWLAISNRTASLRLGAAARGAAASAPAR